jgi:hypothetical protein
MQNVPITDIEYAQLYEQNAPPDTSVVGRIVRYNNNLYWVNSSGAVQITDGTSVNASGIGGIGGDYGGANPASFRFIDASQRYDLYDDYDILQWAYFRCRGVDIADGAATTDMVRLRAPSIAGSYDFTFPTALPGSNRSVLVISSAGAVEPNDSTNTITNDIVLGGTTKIQHGSRLKRARKYPDIITAGNLSYALEILQVSSAPFTGRWDILLEDGQKLTSVSVQLYRLGAGTATLDVRKSTGAVTANVGSQASSASTGAVTLTVSGLTEVIASGSMYHFNLTLPGTDTIELIKITYQQDA